jgi:hypothetical protein
MRFSIAASSLFLLINLINLWPGYSVHYASAQLPNGGCDPNTQASLTINKNFPSNPAQSFPITVTNDGQIIAAGSTVSQNAPLTICLNPGTFSVTEPGFNPTMSGTCISNNGVANTKLVCTLANSGTSTGGAVFAPLVGTSNTTSPGGGNLTK